MAFGLDHIIIQKSQAPAAPGATSISRFAEDLGKPTIIAEAGHAGTANAEDVDALVQGSENVMRHLKMLPGEVRPIENPVWIGQMTTVRSDQDGIFYPLVVPEAYVQQGMRVGYTTDYFGNKTGGRYHTGIGSSCVHLFGAFDEERRHCGVYRRDRRCTLNPLVLTVCSLAARAGPPCEADLRNLHLAVQVVCCTIASVKSASRRSRRMRRSGSPERLEPYRPCQRPRNSNCAWFER